MSITVDANTQRGAWPASHADWNGNSTLMLGAYKKASFFDKDVGWIRSGYVVVWQSAVLVTSPSEGHAVEVRDALSRLGDALLGDWRTANRPPAAAAAAAPIQ